MRKSAIIIGAGVIGVTSAYALARWGWQVTLLDRANGPAMETSHANGAQLSYCFTDALASPATFAALPSLLAGKGGVAFRFPKRLDYAIWLARFARNCTLTQFRRNTLAVYGLAHRSRRAMDELCEQHPIDFSHRVAGKIHLLYSYKDRSWAEYVRELKAGAGCEQHILEREELTQLDLSLTHLDDAVTAAVSTPSEVVGDPLKFCRGLLDILIADYGVEARFGSAVAKIEERNARARVHLANGEVLEADMAVVASATHSNRLLSPLGNTVPIQPMKGYSFEMPLAAGSPRISVTDGKRRLVFTHLGDRMRVAGIAELGNATRHIDQDRIEWMINAARECLPYGGDYAKAGRFWTGLRPVTPNSQPIIKRASQCVAINTGHGALGWTLAMGSAERLAQVLTD